VTAAWGDWPLEEPAVKPDRWVLFHPEQYAIPGFPFRPFTADALCRWYACRQVGTGEPWWVPGWQIFLESEEGVWGPSLSTGLASSERTGTGDGRQDSVVLRGLQEVLERDALVGAWWGRYPLREWDVAEVFAGLGEEKAARLRRPNLRYRCYRIETLWSGHVCLVTLAGEDREGMVFSTGSACRETRTASWEKALLEAVQGRHYVRHLLGLGATWPEQPVDFAGHAVYYSLHPERLADTVLVRAVAGREEAVERSEGLAELVERLGGERPVLVRLLTPGALAGSGWVVVRVLVPGLQPLHGHHGLPFLGGPLWGRPWSAWPEMPPHPFA
jgi:ribosomal protein S12 methylthiotransferase accessory factor